MPNYSPLPVVPNYHLIRRNSKVQQNICTAYAQSHIIIRKYETTAHLENGLRTQQCNDKNLKATWAKNTDMSTNVST